MSEALTSVGLDVGTTSTQMILSRLRIENRASSFAVPDMVITDRTVLYKSPVHFTPLLDESHVDGERLKTLIEEEYRKAGITREQVDTGAIIITGETSRKENAETVLHALSGMAGDFVVAVAGPDLESQLAAKGAGAADYSEKTGKTVLHMDIGGGTSNLALIQNGKISHTGCLNVGGRLIKLDENSSVVYVSPVLQSLFPVHVGQPFSESEALPIVRFLTEALEMAAGLRPWESRHRKLLAEEAAGEIPTLTEPPVISFSGGVADCIETRHQWNAFGDLGPLLGKVIRESRLCQGNYILGKETIRATVIGAGCHSTQLSGSTVFHRNIPFPLQNIPVVKADDLQSIRSLVGSQDAPCILALKGMESPGYREVSAMADSLAAQVTPPVMICLQQDMAKALGQALAVRLPENTPIVCIDRIRVEDNSYLDIGAPVGGAMPVVVKTLVLGERRRI